MISWLKSLFTKKTNNIMITNKAGTDLIKSFESFVPYAYDDAIYPPKKAKEGDKIKGTLTIGYGFTENVKIGDTITKELAEARLKLEILKIEPFIIKEVYRDLTPNQFSALTCFVYNVGEKALHGSTLLKLLNQQKPIEECASEFLKWNKTTIKGKKVVSAGLVKRREAEQALFLS